MYNISFVDFGVTDEPLEVDETWTKAMYICLFLGGFWCSAVIFVLLLAIHAHCEAIDRTPEVRKDPTKFLAALSQGNAMVCIFQITAGKAFTFRIPQNVQNICHEGNGCIATQYVCIKKAEINYRSFVLCQFSCNEHHRGGVTGTIP